jgi:hypothetical protein
LRRERNIILWYICIEVKRYGTFGFFFYSSPFFFYNSLVKKLDIELISNSVKMSVLLCSEDISRAPELKVSHSYLKSCSEFGILANSLKSLLSYLR